MLLVGEECGGGRHVGIGVLVYFLFYGPSGVIS